MSSYQTIKTLGRWLAFPPKLAKSIGMEEAVFLLNIMFWASEESEWVERTSMQLEEETTLTYKQQTRVRERLIDLGLLEVRTNRRDHQTFFRVIEEKFDELVLSIKTEKREFDELTFGSNSTIPKGVSTNLPKGISLKEKEEVQRIEEKEALPLNREERKAIPKPEKKVKLRGWKKENPVGRVVKVPIPDRIAKKQPEGFVEFCRLFSYYAETNAVAQPELWELPDEIASQIGWENLESRLEVYIDRVDKVTSWTAKEFLIGGWRTILGNEYEMKKLDGRR